MIGVQVRKDDISYICGVVSLNLKVNYDMAVSIKEFLDRIGPQGLLDMGFEQSEVDVITSAMNDLAYQKIAAFDSSQFVKRLYGMGINPSLNSQVR